MYSLVEVKPKPRVLISGTLPPPMGGIATYFQNLINSSLPERVDLQFVQSSSQQRPLSSSGRFSLDNIVSAVADIIRFTQSFLKHHPQVTHIATSFGLSLFKHGICVWIARIAGGRVLLHPHCSLQAIYLERPAWSQWFFRQVVGSSSGVLVLSDEWDQLHRIVRTCKVYQLPNAIDLDSYAEVGRVNIKRSYHSGPLRIFYLGYLGKAKGTFDLIEAVDMLVVNGADISLDLVGDELNPGERNQLIQTIKNKDLNGTIHLHLPVSGAEKLAFFRAADVFVYPSYHEGQPMAVIEAMACALPIVATNVGGLPDLVSTGENGLLVEPGKPELLANALDCLMKDRELRLWMQNKSYQRALENYDIEQHVSKLVNVYETVCTN